MFFQSKKFLLSLLAVLFACLANTHASAMPGGEAEEVHQTVPPKEFQQKMNESRGKLLDVRTPQEFERDHLEGALNINFYEDDFQDRLKALPTDVDYFIYCRSGGRSGKTLQIMKDLGFQVVYDMGGGITRWRKEGLPLVLDKNP